MKIDIRGFSIAADNTICPTPSGVDLKLNGKIEWEGISLDIPASEVFELIKNEELRAIFSHLNGKANEIRSHFTSSQPTKVPDKKVVRRTTSKEQ